MLNYFKFLNLSMLLYFFKVPNNVINILKLAKNFYEKLKYAAILDINRKIDD